jgi:hypothetical protein
MSGLEQEYDRMPGEGASRQSWRHWLGWSALLAVAWVVFELTAEPAFAVVVFCGKFGWDDFRTAGWLRRVDPNRPRGRACYYLCLAAGLWKTTLVGIGLFAVFMPLMLLAGKQAPNVPPPPMLGSMIAGYFGTIIAMLFSYRAFWLGLRGRVKFWLDPEVHQARREAIWPAHYPRDAPRNRASFPLTAALVAPIVLLSIFGISLVIGLLAPPPGGRPPDAAAAVVAGLFLGALGVFIVGKRVMRRRLLARSPEECWDVGV